MNKLYDWLHRAVDYIRRPFVVSRALEILHALTWAWYAGLSWFRGYINDPYLKLTEGVPDWIVASIFTLLAFLSIWGLLANRINVRRMMLIISIFGLVYLLSFLLYSGTIAGITGYLVTLIALTFLVLWRLPMDY